MSPLIRRAWYDPNSSGNKTFKNKGSFLSILSAYGYIALLIKVPRSVLNTIQIVTNLGLTTI